MQMVVRHSSRLTFIVWMLVAMYGVAQTTNDTTAAEATEQVVDSSTLQESQPASPQPQWHYGGFVDLGYLLDFNHPANKIFRSRGTTWHVDDLHMNMAAAYIRKDATEQSHWGTQLTVQGGKDAEVFGFSATAPNLPGYKGLRHLGLANVSYLAPVGNGLTPAGWHLRKSHWI